MKPSDLSRWTHALRNHLNGIAMNAELAKLEIETPSIEQNQDASSEQVKASLDCILLSCRESAELLLYLEDHFINVDTDGKE